MNPDFLPFCFLPLNKPAGPTSHDMVAAVRRMLPRQVKVGHTGTLDPFASGVMILALGKATRFSDDVHLLEKGYLAEIALGRRTNTLDNTGEVDLELPVPELTAAGLAALAERFHGEQLQVPPAFSAKRVGGVKSYALARKNQAVPLAAKKITISALALEATGPDRLLCRVTCSTGTYVRALARDLAEALGTCGHLTGLVRTRVGPILLEHCPMPEQVVPDSLPDWTWPVWKLLPAYPMIHLPATSLEDCLQGRPFSASQALPPTFLACFETEGQIHAIFRCEYLSGANLVHPRLRCYLHEP